PTRPRCGRISKATSVAAPATRTSSTRSSTTPAARRNDPRGSDEGSAGERMSNAMVDFAYARPTTLAQAGQLLAEPEATALAGGQSLIPALKQRLARPRLLVDLQDLAELRGVEVNDTHVRLGAFTRHAEVAADPRIAEALPALAHNASGLAPPQVPHKSTP